MFDTPSDTHPEIVRRMTELYRAMSPDEKARKLLSLTTSVHQLALARLREEHPGASERELLLRLAAQLYGPELVYRATGFVAEP